MFARAAQGSPPDSAGSGWWSSSFLPPKRCAPSPPRRSPSYATAPTAPASARPRRSPTEGEPSTGDSTGSGVRVASSPSCVVASAREHVATSVPAEGPVELGHQFVHVRLGQREQFRVDLAHRHRRHLLEVLGQASCPFVRTWPYVPTR